VDGDRRVRVRGATVELLKARTRTNRDGVAEIRVGWRRDLNVTVGAPGFERRTLLVPFEDSRKATLRIYRPDLQWPTYGATAERSQAQTHTKLRPPFRTVWSVGLDGLIEFPAVVKDGVAYIANAQGTVYAISMRNGHVLWRHPTPGARMASSPAVVGRDLVYH